MSNQTHTWQTFKAYIDAQAERDTRLFYRGQSNDSWGLISTYYRLVNPGDPATYWQLLHEVNDVVATWTGRTWNLENHVELGAFLGFLQHNGFPTPLLDWTKSPYTAAYFAFEGVDDAEPQSNNIAVFAFDQVAWERDWQQVRDINVTIPHVSILLAQARGNQKQLVQQGTYTFSNVRDQEVHLRAHERRRGESTGQPTSYLTKLTISVQEKPRAMRDLRLMGISAMSLSPGVEGVCRALRDTFFSAPQVGLTPEARTMALIEALLRVKTEREAGDPAAAAGEGLLNSLLPDQALPQLEAPEPHIAPVPLRSGKG